MDTFWKYFLNSTYTRIDLYADRLIRGSTYTRIDLCTRIDLYASIYGKTNERKSEIREGVKDRSGNKEEERI